jgi:hypothetical protein
MKQKLNTKKIMAFSESVSEFSKKVNTECNELNAASFRFSKRTGMDEDKELRAMTNSIQKLLAESEDDLLDISKRVEKYAMINDVLKKAKKGQ